MDICGEFIIIYSKYNLNSIKNNPKNISPIQTFLHKTPKQLPATKHPHSIPTHQVNSQGPSKN